MASPSWTQNPVTPKTLASGLALWLDAHRGVTLDASGNVSQWTDQSASFGNDATQSTPGYRPAYSTSDAGYNSQPVVVFNSATPDFMTLASNLPAQPFTIYVLGESTSGTAQQQFFGDNNANVCMYKTSTSNQWAIYSAGSVASNNAVQGSAQAFAGVFNSATSALYIDNSQTAAGSGAITNDSPSGVQALGCSSGGSNGLNGKIAEMFVFRSAHTAAQVQQAFRYLAARYALHVT